MQSKSPSDQNQGINPLEILNLSHLFAGADDKAKNWFVSKFEEIEFERGSPILMEHEVADEVYFVKKGRVEIISFQQETKQETRVALLSPGQHFGEFSVLTGTSKSGSAYAYEDVILLKIKAADFLKGLQSFPLIAKNLAYYLAAILHQGEKSNVFIHFFNEDMVKVCPQILQFLPLSQWQKMGIIPISLRGKTLSVAMVDPANPLFFNFMKNSPRACELQVFLIQEEDYHQSLESVANRYKKALGDPTLAYHEADETFEEDWDNLLKKSLIFSDLPQQILNQVKPYWREHLLEAGELLFDEGAPGDCIFLVEEGELEVSHNVKENNFEVYVASMKRGDVFGELALMTKGGHSLKARAVTKTKVRRLPDQVFSQLFQIPALSISVARLMAKRIESLSHVDGMRIYQGNPLENLRSLVGVLPLKVIEEQKMMPLELENGLLRIGLVQPHLNTALAHANRYVPDLRVSFELIADKQFKHWLQQLREYQHDQKPDTASSSPLKKGRLQRGVDSVSLLDMILLEALQKRASDIHVEPGEECVSVRYRIDGALLERDETLNHEMGRELVGRIKVLAKMDISNIGLPQDGQLHVNMGGVKAMARVSTLPTKFGETTVLRVIRGKGSIVPLNSLAPDVRVVNILRGVTHCKQGLFLVTGPTGSGKTTTLYSMLSELNRIDVNLITIEDPVEKDIGGITQVQVDRKRGLDFNVALRSILRQDPDVVMVGEIRDEESAKIVFDAAMTGHLVLSTLHTNSALDTIPRLIELGVSPATIATGLLGVLSQRLVRANCNHCIQERAPTEYEIGLFKSYLPHWETPMFLKEGAGCAKCNGTGYFDRLPVFEIFRMTADLKNSVIEGVSREKVGELARKDGFETIAQFALRLAALGMTSVSEARKWLAQV